MNEFKCSDCNATYGSQNSLSEHERLRHQGRTFKCELCDKVFERPTSVTRHMKSAHKNKPMKATQTVLSYDDRGNWLCRAGSGERLCGRMFAYNEQSKYYEHIDLHASSDAFGETEKTSRPYEPGGKNFLKPVKI